VFAQHLLSGLFATVFLTVTTALFAQGNTAATPAEKTTAAPAEGWVSPARQGILRLLSQLESSYEKGDASALAVCWTENGEFVGPAGARADGREAIEKLFAETFAARKGGTLVVHLVNLRLVNDRLALVDVAAEIKAKAGGAGDSLVTDSSAASRVTAMVLVKQNDRWSIESAHETISQAPPQTNHLKDLEWLVGNWTTETSKEGISLHSSCDWTADRAFLIQKFTVEGKGIFLHGGTEIIGWDPRENRIRSWVFDADGGFGQNIWVRDGDRWLLKYAGTLADGRKASATNIIVKVDTETVMLQAKDRIVDGQQQADVPEIRIKRQAAAKPGAGAENTTTVP
jgi:uncharacterized protein (TIGR02246 family)